MPPSKSCARRRRLVRTDPGCRRRPRRSGCNRSCDAGSCSRGFGRRRLLRAATGYPCLFRMLRNGRVESLDELDSLRVRPRVQSFDAIRGSKLGEATRHCVQHYMERPVERDEAFGKANNSPYAIAALLEDSNPESEQWQLSIEVEVRNLGEAECVLRWHDPRDHTSNGVQQGDNPSSCGPRPTKVAVLRRVDEFAKRRDAEARQRRCDHAHWQIRCPWRELSEPLTLACSETGSVEECPDRLLRWRRAAKQHAKQLSNDPFQRRLCLVPCGS